MPNAVQLIYSWVWRAGKRLRISSETSPGVQCSSPCRLRNLLEPRSGQPLPPASFQPAQEPSQSRLPGSGLLQEPLWRRGRNNKNQTCLCLQALYTLSHDCCPLKSTQISGFRGSNEKVLVPPVPFRRCISIQLYLGQSNKVLTIGTCWPVTLKCRSHIDFMRLQGLCPSHIPSGTFPCSVFSFCMVIISLRIITTSKKMVSTLFWKAGDMTSRDVNN